MRFQPKRMPKTELPRRISVRTRQGLLDRFNELMVHQAQKGESLPGLEAASTTTFNSLKMNEQSSGFKLEPRIFDMAPEVPET
jgi:hypothetical protein